MTTDRVSTTQQPKLIVPECVPGLRSVVIERHRPTKFAIPYHHHASVEINFLSGCCMTYAFDQHVVEAADQKLTLFWGAVPHSVSTVAGNGEIVNVYVSLSEFLSWNLPDTFARAIIAGRVVSCLDIDPIDPLLFARWANESLDDDNNDAAQIAAEVAVRVRRLAVTGWKTLSPGLGEDQNVGDVTGDLRKVEAMLQHVAENFAHSLTVPEVARCAVLSESHAARIFRNATGISIKEHIIRTRLAHARNLLAHSQAKILSVAMDSGFQSVSAFYKAFEEREHLAPAAFRRQMQGR